MATRGVSVGVTRSPIDTSSSSCCLELNLRLKWKLCKQKVLLMGATSFSMCRLLPMFKSLLHSRQFRWPQFTQTSELIRGFLCRWRRCYRVVQHSVEWALFCLLSIKFVSVIRAKHHTMCIWVCVNVSRYYKNHYENRVHRVACYLCLISCPLLTSLLYSHHLSSSLFTDPSSFISPLLLLSPIL